MYLVSIYFDEKTDKRIRQLIKAVAKESGNTYMLDANVPPHTTIGKKLSEAEMIKAFIALQKVFGMFEGKVIRIGLAKTNPYQDIASWDLG